jgi:aromatic ring-opening dioxygenase catalytic subunit (LigB family)
LYGAVHQHLEAVDPDVLVMFDSDHFSSFFLNNLPAFAVGVAETTNGPGNDDDWGIPTYTGIPVQQRVADHVYRRGLEHGFDLSLSQEFTLDHSMLVPLHFLNPGMRRPFVPVWINGLVHPLPLARRCYALGATLRDMLATLPDPLRVAIVASGTLSGDIGTARAFPGGDFGPADEVWSQQVIDRMQRGDIDTLLNEATGERLWAAGNASGEVLNWIALLGAIGNRKPRLVEHLRGNAWAAWRWD